MSTNSKIEWTDATWNPVTGCTKVSPGCANCYIERTPPFRIGHRKFDANGTTGVVLHPERLEQPLHWNKPRRVFVNSLSDLFHESVPDEYLFRIFGVIAKAQNHIFQVLTKRPQRMRNYMHEWRPVEKCFPNLWLGVSVENQHFADERIPLLLQTPAAVRFISAEPLLGPVNLTAVMEKLEPQLQPPVGQSQKLRIDALRCFVPKHLDWVIVGGESGPGSRPMHPDWARSLRDQCQAAGVKFFFKQWGNWGTHRKLDDTFAEKARGAVNWKEWPDGTWMHEWGKKLAGRELDGREWNEFPQ